LLLFALFNLGATWCFKQGGTDPAHRLACFIGGNALGVTSTWFMMQLCRCLNVNIAMVLSGSLAFISVQALFWWLYRPAMQPAQWLGVAVILVGTLLAAWHPVPATEERP